jgi:dTDP-4-dehydrorhamnose 3,5-epimerase-like enzyme
VNAQCSAQVFEDERGRLTLVEAEAVPFVVRRTYVLHDMPVGARRGGHANLTQSRLLVGLSGAPTINTDDGREQRTVTLEPGRRLLIGPRVWHEILIHHEHTTILVFAEGGYDPEDSVGDRPAAAAAAASQTLSS